MQQLHSAHAFELRADQVLAGAVAVRAVGVLTWRGLGERQKLFHRFDGQAGVDHQHVGHQGYGGDGGKTLLEVVTQLLVYAGGNGVVHCAHQQGVAIGLGLGHVVGPQGGPGTGFVFHDHGLAQGLSQLNTHSAGQHISGAPGRERHDQVHRLRGKGLRKGGPSHQRGGCHRGAQQPWAASGAWLRGM